MSKPIKIPVFIRVQKEIRVFSEEWKMSRKTRSRYVYVSPRKWEKEEYPKEIRFSPPAEEGRVGLAEVPEYLDALMKVENPTDALQFLKRFGNIEPDLPGEGPPHLTHFEGFEFAYSGERAYVYFSEIRELQTRVRSASELPISQWSGLVEHFGLEDLPLDLHYAEGGVRGTLRTPSGAQACAAQLFFEKIAGADHGWCALPDCDRMFRKTSKHAKKYCSTEHAHLAAVRADLERKRRGRELALKNSEIVPQR